MSPLSAERLEALYDLVNLLEEACPQQLAGTLKSLKPSAKEKAIAAMANVDRTTLFRSDKYREFKERIASTNAPPRGRKGRDGNVEAWVEEEDAG